MHTPIDVCTQFPVSPLSLPSFEKIHADHVDHLILLQLFSPFNSIFRLLSLSTKMCWHMQITILARVSQFQLFRPSFYRHLTLLSVDISKLSSHHRTLKFIIFITRCHRQTAFCFCFVLLLFIYLETRIFTPIYIFVISFSIFWFAFKATSAAAIVIVIFNHHRSIDASLILSFLLFSFPCLFLLYSLYIRISFIAIRFFFSFFFACQLFLRKKTIFKSISLFIHCFLNG